MNTSLLLVLHKKRATLAFDGLRDYAQALEQLLGAETARVYTVEALSDIAARARDSSLEPSEPSEELFGLRDSFPTILRGSLLPYVHGTFEVAARKVANLFLVDGKLLKGDNTNRIVERVNSSWPGTIDDEATLRLADYMHLRHSCAHTAAEIGNSLFDAKRVAKAAERTQGARFRSLAPAATGQRHWAGVIEFEPDFLSQAIVFHTQQLDRIAQAVEAPPTSFAPKA